MAHRALILLTRVAPENKSDVSHDEKMSLVWRLLEESTVIHHDGEEKPYCWTMDYDKDTKSATLIFSSIFPDVTAKLIEKAKNIIGSAIRINQANWIPNHAMAIQDIDYLDTWARISSTNGVVSWKTIHPTIDSIRRLKKKTYDIDTDLTGFTNDIRDILIRKAKKFLQKDFAKEDIQIRHVHRLNYGHVDYKGMKIPYQNISCKIIAPQEIIELAVYGGIGSKTGSGFGMVDAA